jgi:hypothetical protein
MNCDDAFDFLTDPSRRDSAALLAHLERCPRCRQMRDVLEPALDLFGGPAPASSALNEAITAAYDSDGDTNRASVLSPETLQIAEQAAAQLSSTRAQRAPAKGWPVVAVCRYAAVFLVGTLLSLALTADRSDRAPDSASPPPASQCTWKNQTQENWRQELRARQVVQSCVACHLQEQPVAPESDFDRFLAPEVILPEVKVTRPVETAILEEIGELEWRICNEMSAAGPGAPGPASAINQRHA